MSGIELLLNDARGVYIPQNFAESYATVFNLGANDVEILLQGPDAELYWDTWTDVLDNANYTDSNGKVWTLWQDGDLFAVCPDLMTDEEYSEFFGEMKPAPDDAYEYEVCGNCLMALANDDYTGVTDAEEAATKSGLDVLHKTYDQVIPDGAEYGFSSSRCECCDALSGDRFRVLCFGKKED